MATKAKNTDKLEALLEAAVDAIITIDARGIIKSVNQSAEKLFQYKRSEFIGRKINFLMPDPWASEHDGYMERYQRTGHRRIIGIGREVEGLKSDRSTFPMHLSVSEYAVDGETFFTGIIHDLSERKEAQEALAHAQKMEAMGQLTGGIAHDFNNLLTVITGNLELLEPSLETDFQRTLLKDATEAAELGSNLTNRLLAFARRSPLSPKVVDLNALVDSLSIMFSRVLGETIEYRSVLDRDLWSTRVDPGQVESALLNLSLNARDAMPSGGRLVIETHNYTASNGDDEQPDDVMGDSFVRISVSDTGYGMTRDVLDKACDPFFTTKETGKGTGLGLSMVFGFAKQSGGYMSLYSEPGLGTTINIYLPRHHDEDAVEDDLARAGLQVTAMPEGSGETILVVEDDHKVQAITVQRLKALNYEPLTANNGIEALAVLESDIPIDLVFTDLIMPGDLSGYDLVRRIRAEHPEIKILMTSGYAEDLINHERLDAHDVALLRKPYKQDALARMIRQALGQPTLEAENSTSES